MPDVIVDNSESWWSWLAAQERLAEAFERGGIDQFSELVVGELELERRKRGLGDSTAIKR